MRTSRRSNGNNIIANTKAQAARAISEGVKAGHDLMMRLVAVDKGDLKSTTTMEDDGAGHASLATGGQSNISDRYVSHHIYIEYGTRKMGAQPYYRPGIDLAKQEVKARMKIVG